MELKTIILIAIVIGCFVFGGKNIFKSGGSGGSGGSGKSGGFNGGNSSNDSSGAV